MGKYRIYKNRLEMFLAGELGKRVLNFCYSWGASVVIIGAMFKILHWPYANLILVVAMSIEALVFWISAFEVPVKEEKIAKQTIEEHKRSPCLPYDYLVQIDRVNQDVSFLNTLYKGQLEYISSQTETIERINRELVELNRVYSRLLCEMEKEHE